MVQLMLRTGISIREWERLGPEVIETAIDLLTTTKE